MDQIRLQTEVLKLRQRIHRLSAVIRLLLALVRIVGMHLDQVRLPEGAASCRRSTPTRLTADEILEIKSMVMSPEYRHVSTGRLAVLAQRLGRVFAAPATWYKLVRERGWRRPRMRVHPQQPKQGVRATEPDELWHVDMTVIKLVDGTKVFLHAVIDNFSRRILAWRVSDRFEFGTTVTLLQEAARGTVSVEDTPTLVADGGVENINAGVDELIETLAKGRRLLPYVDVPLQHASDRILRAMKRGVTAARQTRLVERLRAQLPGAVLRSTFIVGFPGETEEDFRELCDFVRSFRFDRLGVFRYSDEEGTGAFEHSSKVPREVAQERHRELMGIQRGIMRELLEAQVGSDVQVLVDQAGPGGATGRLWSQAPEIDGQVLLRGGAEAGELVDARVTGVLDVDLEAVRSAASAGTG